MGFVFVCVEGGWLGNGGGVFAWLGTQGTWGLLAWMGRTDRGFYMVAWVWVRVMGGGT